MIPNELRAPLAFLKKEVRSALTYRYSFFSGILYGLISLMFYFSMASLFKAAIVQSAIPYGGDYVAFLITGAVLWQVVTFGLYSISGTLTIEMVSGTLEMIYMSRANILHAVIGISAFSFLRNTLLALLAMVFASAVFSIALHFENLLFAFLILVMTYLSMLGIGIAVAGITMITKSTGRLMGIFTLVLSVLSGVIFPTSLLPDWAVFISRFIPITYALDGLRSLLLVGSGFDSVSGTISVLFLMCLVFIPAGYMIFFRCIDVARKQGSLSQF